MKLKAKKLVLDLLVAAQGEPVSARDIVSACRLFGISENNARVSVARMSGDGLIESAGRGRYRLTAEASTLGSEVSAWRHAEARLRDWSGGYIVAYTAGLGRSDRTALRKRERALQMMGFRALEAGLFLRPDNIEPDLDTVRSRLHKLGLEAQTPVFLAEQFDRREQKRIPALWDRQALNRSYREQTRLLRRWLERCNDLEPDVAARESFMLGGAAIRQIVFDPLLPDELIDVELRHAFFRTVRDFDTAGQQVWRQLHQSLATATTD